MFSLRKRVYAAFDEGGKSDTDGNVGGDLVIKHMRNVQIENALADPFRRLHGTFSIDVGEHNHELFPAVARDNIP